MPKLFAYTALAVCLALAGCTFELTSAGGTDAAPVPGCRSGDMACAGQAIAEGRCARCHATGTSGISPYPGAQPFRTFWQRWTRPALFGALKTGIIVEHDRSGVRLPEMKLEEAEITALFAYLDTVKEQ